VQTGSLLIPLRVAGQVSSPNQISDIPIQVGNTNITIGDIHERVTTNLVSLGTKYPCLSSTYARAWIMERDTLFPSTDDNPIYKKRR